jgi:hypothetical protein
MRKIILTENQVLMVKKHVINESEENRYRRKVKVDIGVNHEQRYKGFEIDYVTPYTSEIEVSYLIEQEHRSWGIKGISLYNIKGPSEIVAEITYYPDDLNDTMTDEITIPLDWENLSTDEVSNGLITVGDELDITLYISENGEYSVEMSIDVYTL